MRPLHVVIVYPLRRPLHQLPFISDPLQKRQVELLVVGAMAALHPPIVAFPPQGEAHPLRSQGPEEPLVESLDLLQALPTPLTAPIGLPLELLLDPMRPQPEEHKPCKAEGVGQGVLAAEGQEAQAGAPLQEGPLVARQMGLLQVVHQARPQGPFIADVLDVHLGQGEGLLSLPGPVGRVADLPTAPRLHQAVTTQDVADGVGGEPKPLGGAVPQLAAEPLAAVAGLFSQLDHLLLQGRGNLSWAGMGTAAAIFQPSLALALPAPHPLAHHLTAGLPEPGGLGDGARPLVGLDELVLAWVLFMAYTC